jgi:hypothetical protein
MQDIKEKRFSFMVKVARACNYQISRRVDHQRIGAPAKNVHACQINGSHRRKLGTKKFRRP